MFNDTSQHSVATRFRYGGMFDHYFVTYLLLSPFRDHFKLS